MSISISIQDEDIDTSLSQGDNKPFVCLSDIESLRSADQQEADKEKASSSSRTEIYMHQNRSIHFSLKIGFVVALFAIAGCVGFSTYHFTRAREINAYHTSFEEDALHVITSAQESGMRSQLATTGITYDMSTLNAVTPLVEWPFTTIRSFEAISFPALHQSIATHFFVSPLLRDEETREAWEAYATSTRPQLQNISSTGNRSVADGIYRLGDSGLPEDDRGPAPCLPIWHVAPRSDENNYLMFNQASDPVQKRALESMLAGKFQSSSEIFISEKTGEPQFVKILPIFDTLEREHVVASLSLLINVGIYIDVKLPTDNTVVAVVLSNQCGQTYTFHVLSDSSDVEEQPDRRVIFVGEGDLHDRRYNDFAKYVSVEETRSQWLEFLSQAPPELLPFYKRSENATNATFTCELHATIYPTVEYESAFLTGDPLSIALGTSMAIILTAVLFLTYIIYVEKRQRDLLKRVRRSNETNGALVESFFPSVVRDRVVRRSSLHAKSSDVQRLPITASTRNGLEHFLPIAEQFPNTTVFFADIVGFTAWSSQREPEQVFNLLETLYERFDTLAKRFGVYKVETIGDCYMAVTGLPEPNAHHAVVAARFAYECIGATVEISKELEASLGPGTSDLALRIGLHSGTVTGGVLRGEKARFQLFGDTVNTAARMESNGVTGRVQVSQATADLIIGAGKEHWVLPRRTLVKAKGKGEMQTYFVKPRRRPGPGKKECKAHYSTPPLSPNCVEDEASPHDELIPDYDESTYEWGSTSTSSFNSPRLDRDGRLIEWNTENLLNCLLNNDHTAEHIGTSSYGFVFGEYQATVRSQLHALISHLSTLFPELPYHNFEHASVLAMFANKLMKEAIQQLRAEQGGSPVFEQFYAIVHFTAVFAVMVRDIQYRPADRSVDVVGVVLDLLKTKTYNALYFALSGSEGSTFEIVLCDCLKASTSFSSDLYQGGIELQGNVTFAADPNALLPDKMLEIVSLVTRSSEVSHWLQHWKTFSAWHGNLFSELHSKHLTGYCTYDPTKTWVQDELDFFKKVVLPLATELEVKGLGSEYLARAKENHREWLVAGKQVTQSLIE